MNEMIHPGAMPLLPSLFPLPYDIRHPQELYLVIGVRTAWKRNEKSFIEKLVDVLVL